MTFYRRTPKGDQEIVFRGGGLGPDLRNLLLLINGRRDVPALASLVPALRGSLDALSWLEGEGYIELDLNVAMAAAPPMAMQSGAPQQNWPQPVAAPSPAMTAPVAAPQVAAPAPGYPAPERVDLGFATRREQLMQHLAVALGPDYETVGRRLSQVRDAAELQTLEKKLVDLVRLYRGQREAQQFSDKFKISA